jgi:hypothetical protein
MLFSSVVIVMAQHVTVTKILKSTVLYVRVRTHTLSLSLKIILLYCFLLMKIDDGDHEMQKIQ